MKSITGKTYKYNGIDIIGSGAYGNIRSVLRDDGKEYVVKLYHKRDYPELNIGVLREISILKILENNNSNLVELEDIVCMYNRFQIYGLIMKKYKCDLYDIIEKKELNLEKRIYIAHRLIEAVYFLHHNGIIHRDIKLENILLDEKDNPFLCDFSLSKVFDDLSTDDTHTGNVVSEIYRAPEVKNKQAYSYPIDVWSLGIVLYQLFTMEFIYDYSLNELYSYLDDMLDKTSNNIFHQILTKMLENNQHKRITLKEIIESNFFHTKPKNFKKINYLHDYKVSSDVEKICQHLGVRKQITYIASQIYVDKSNCSIESAVKLASKIYELIPINLEYDGYVEEEILILEKMDFNLFIKG